MISKNKISALSFFGLLVALNVLLACGANATTSIRGVLGVAPSGEMRLDVEVYCSVHDEQRAKEGRIQCLKSYQTALHAGESSAAMGPGCESLPAEQAMTCHRETYDNCMLQARDAAQRHVQCPAGTEARELAKLKGGTATVASPWDERISVPLASEPRSFAVQWKQSNYSSELSYEEISRSNWQITLPGGLVSSWSPDSSQVEAIREVVGEAKGTLVVRGGPPPQLEVVATLGADQELHYGAKVALEVSVTNRGSGAAYRVEAKTKSGYEPFDAKQLWFGRVRPEERVTQSLEIELPDNSSSSDEVLIIMLGEANGYAPAEVTKHVKIKASNHPVLELICSLGGDVDLRNPQRPVADPGKSVSVKCTIANKGTSVAKAVTLSLSLGDNSDQALLLGDIAAGKARSHDSHLTLPSNAQLDTVFRLAAAVAETSFNKQASWSTDLYAGTPKLCPSPISRAEYKERKAKLEKARDLGALDVDEFNRLHAELVHCLK